MGNEKEVSGSVPPKTERETSKIPSPVMGAVSSQPVSTSAVTIKF